MDRHPDDFCFAAAGDVHGHVRPPTGEPTTVCCLDEVAQGPDSGAPFQAGIRELTG